MTSIGRRTWVRIRASAIAASTATARSTTTSARPGMRAFDRIGT